MEVKFKSNKLKKYCENTSELCKKGGDIMANKIVQRINELNAANCLFDIYCLPQTRLHPLKGKRKGQLAVDLKHPYRLVIEPLNGAISDYSTITEIVIIEITDYH